MEICKYQKNPEILIAKRLFSKLVREVTEQVIQDNGGKHLVRWQATALLAIQTAGEDYIVKLFEAAQLNAIHSKQQTIMPMDMHLSRHVKRIFDDNAI
jgi:histone H3/H4